MSLFTELFISMIEVIVNNDGGVSKIMTCTCMKLDVFILSWEKNIYQLFIIDLLFQDII